MHQHVRAKPANSSLTRPEMVLDVNKEKLLTFRELSKRVPHRRENRPLAVSTVHRWCAFGVRGIRLEAVRMGGSWLTSEEAFARFCQRLTSASEPSAKHGLGAASHRNANTSLDKQLDLAIGIKNSPTVRSFSSISSLKGIVSASYWMSYCLVKRRKALT